MAKHNTSELIEQFLQTAKAYFNQAQTEQIQSLIVAATPPGEHADATQLLAAQSERAGYRAELVKIIPRLAAALESDDHDSTMMLQFQHAIDGGGGPSAATPIWSALKPMLQRCLVRQGIETTSRRPRGRPQDTDSKKDEQIYDAWHSGHYQKLEHLERDLRMPEGEARKAIDRHRQRQKRKAVK